MMQIFFTNFCFSCRLLEKHVNTYGFTKGLVEQLVYDYSKKFPTVVARPPISKCKIRKIITKRSSNTISTFKNCEHEIVLTTNFYL